MKDLRQVIRSAPALTSADNSTDEVLHFLNEWNQWREDALKLAESLPETRTVRFCANSGCDTQIPDNARKDRRFCSPRCRAESSRHTGEIGSVRRLKCGKMSYTIHGAENGLKPGDVIKWRKELV